MSILVDSNVILELVHRDPVWLEWSKSALEESAPEGLQTNAMIYGELCCSAESTGEIDTLLDVMKVEMLEIAREALFLAAKTHLLHRRRGGTRTTGLPDFFIGAHAETSGLALLTRDQGRYRTYFPGVPLICP